MLCSGFLIESGAFLYLNSGLAVANSNKTEYLYGGKELPQLFGIDWYDSVARWLTTSGAFVSPDPLMEKYYSISPYAYCAGNPVNLVDPEGLSWYFDKDTGEFYEHIDDEDDKVYMISETDYESASESDDYIGALQALRGDNLFGGVYGDPSMQKVIKKVISFFYDYANRTQEGGADLLYRPGISSVEWHQTGESYFESNASLLKVYGDHDLWYGYDFITLLAHEIQHQLDIKSGYYKKHKNSKPLLELRADNFAQHHWAYEKSHYASKVIEQHIGEQY